MRKRKLPSWILALMLGVAAVALAFVVSLFVLLFSGMRLKEEAKRSYIYVRPGDSFSDVLAQLQTKADLDYLPSFVLLAKQLGYDKMLQAGAYEIKDGMTCRKLFDRIRQGKQSPIRLTFHNIRTKEQLAGRLGRQLFADSSSIINLFNDAHFIASKGLTPETSTIYFIPNTYELYWMASPEQVFNRMEREYKKFWNEERLALAAEIPLTPAQVSVLASIVEEETNKKHEAPIVAGLYINRLRKGMPLQADPTVKFAVNDFSLKRILRVHLAVESPYNTYRNPGLPPGPIRLPSPSNIDAVLRYDRNNYLYMCAKESLNGEHNFAATLEQHNRNAQKYRHALNRLKIYR